MCQGVWNVRGMEYMLCLQTILHLNKKCLSDESDVQMPRTCIQNRLLFTLNREKIRRNNANKTFFWDAKILAIPAYFYII